MAPTEQKILTNYLLAPSQLPAIISLAEFIALFPRPLQSSPRIRSLYRDLQSQRNAVIDSVADEIEAEVKQGKAMRRAVIRSRREADAQEQDDEVEIERMVSSIPPRCRLGRISAWLTVCPAAWKLGKPRTLQAQSCHHPPRDGRRD